MIPGIHRDFDTSDVERYLEHRSQTNRNVSGIESKIKKMGEKCGWILCNTRFQQPSLQFQRLRSKKADIKRQRRVAGLDDTTNEALGTGNYAITLLLSGLDIRSMPRLRGLNPVNREFTAIHVMQHKGCLRFGLFRYTNPVRGDLVFARQDQCYVLYSTWRKTRKSNRPYSIRFPVKPPASDPSRYKLPGVRGPTYVTAGKIIEWYLEASNLTHAPPDALLFPRLAQVVDRRAAYARWLHYMYTNILNPGSTIPARIRPHSARAGWATDRSRQNVATHTILAEGRWKDPRAMRQYIRTNVRDLMTSSEHRLIPATIRSNWPPPPPNQQ